MGPVAETETAPGDRQDSAVVLNPDLKRVLPLAELFGRLRPVEVDIGCGKGQFLVARALKYPDINFLGVDRQSPRLFKVDKKARHAGLSNVRLVHAEAAGIVEHMLPGDGVTTYYIFFPDPWPKRKHHRRRLVSGPFLDSLHRTLVAGGQVHVATDHLDYGAEIRARFERDGRFEAMPAFKPEEDERTNFEQLFLSQNKEISRCSYRKRAIA